MHIAFFNTLLLTASCTPFLAVHAQTFTNTTAAGCDAWNSGNAYTGFQRTITVSGLPTVLDSGEVVLRQVELQLGSSTCKGNLSSYFARIVSPSGTIIQLFSPFTTIGTSQWMNIKFRDDPALERVRDYNNVTQQNYHPWSIGYYRTDVAGAFASVLGEDPNGNWTLQIAENTTTEVSFVRVALVFGPPVVVKDVTGSTANGNCDLATCLDPFEVVRGTNNGYSFPDPNLPQPPTIPTIGGCSWNGANNNAGWYRFIASGTTAYITVSGLRNTTSTTSADQQLLVVRAPGTGGNCVGVPNVVPTGGCPDPPGTLANGNNTAYLSPNGGVGTVDNIYSNGITANAEFNLVGLTPGQDYYLIIDGNGGVASTFYIEMVSGGENCIILLPVTWAGVNATCTGNTRRVRWTVASQTNNDRFEVERSTDMVNWNVFAVVAGEGNSPVPMTYEVVDDGFQPAVTTVRYYRIRQVDFNGATSLSPVVASTCDVVVFPNPATDRVTIVLPTGGMDVEIVDATGRLVRHQYSMDAVVTLDLTGMASGYYLLRTLSDGRLVGHMVLIKQGEP